MEERYLDAVEVDGSKPSAPTQIVSISCGFSLDQEIVEPKSKGCEVA